MPCHDDQTTMTERKITRMLLLSHPTSSSKPFVAHSSRSRKMSLLMWNAMTEETAAGPFTGHTRLTKTVIWLGQHDWTTWYEVLRKKETRSMPDFKGLMVGKRLTVGGKRTEGWQSSQTLSNTRYSRSITTIQLRDILAQQPLTSRFAKNSGGPDSRSISKNTLRDAELANKINPTQARRSHRSTRLPRLMEHIHFKL